MTEKTRVIVAGALGPVSYTHLDQVNKKIYILEPDTQYVREDDGSIRLVDQ